MPDRLLFFVALCPDSEDQPQWDALKYRASFHFQSYKALTSPLHLTLIPPFRENSDQIEVIEKKLEEVSLQFPSFDLSLTGIRSFYPRTVYIGIKDVQKLHDLRTQLIPIIVRSDKIKVHHTWTPHLTLLNRDLDARKCDQALQDIALWEMPDKILLKRLVLFEHIGHQWNIRNSWSLSCD